MCVYVCVCVCVSGPFLDRIHEVLRKYIEEIVVADSWCVCMYVCMVCMYVCMYVCTYIKDVVVQLPTNAVYK